MTDDPDALAVITARLTSRVWAHQAAGRADSAQLIHDLIHDLTGQTSCPVCT